MRPAAAALALALAAGPAGATEWSALRGPEGCEVSGLASNPEVEAARAAIRAKGTVDGDALSTLMSNMVEVRVKDGAVRLVIVAGVDRSRPVEVRLGGIPLTAFAPGACPDVKKGVSACALDADASAAVLAAPARALLEAAYGARRGGRDVRVAASLAGLSEAAGGCQ